MNKITHKIANKLIGTEILGLDINGQWYDSINNDSKPIKNPLLDFLMKYLYIMIQKDLWKDAQGEELPEIDREVIALLENGKVVFAHRPPKRWYGRDLDGEEHVFKPKTYDKGEWNIPNVVWWLDLDLPIKEE